jgi:hypothetical protein
VRRRAALLVVAVLAALGASVAGTTGFTSASAERSVSVGVVDDDRALVDVSTTPLAGEDAVEVTVRNQFGVAVDVTVDGTTRPVGPGGTTTVRLDCGSDARADVSVVSSTDPGVSVALERPVSCPEKDDDDSDEGDETDDDDGNGETDENDDDEETDGSEDDHDNDETDENDDDEETDENDDDDSDEGDENDDDETDDNDESDENDDDNDENDDDDDDDDDENDESDDDDGEDD